METTGQSVTETTPQLPAVIPPTDDKFGFPPFGVAYEEGGELKMLPAKSLAEAERMALVGAQTIGKHLAIFVRGKVAEVRHLACLK